MDGESIKKESFSLENLEEILLVEEIVFGVTGNLKAYIVRDYDIGKRYLYFDGRKIPVSNLMEAEMMNGYLLLDKFKYKIKSIEQKTMSLKEFYRLIHNNHSKNKF
jgi:putative IMPACT (imprinted ancient) family translation regulator